MPRYGNKSNVRQLGNRRALSMAQGGEYARKCLGLALATSLFRGVPVYAQVDKDYRQAKVRFYLDDGPAEGWVDLGVDVREELAMLLEEAFDAETANAWYDAIGDRPPEQAQEASNGAYVAPTPRKRRSVPPEAS